MLTVSISNLGLGRLASYMFLLASLLVIFLLRQLVFADGGLLEVVSLKEQLVTQKQEVIALSKRNRDISARIKVLKSFDEAVEGQARHELGFIKPHESFYQVVLAVYDDV